MQKLSEETINILESKGLTLFGKTSESISVGKPISVAGNCIEWDIRKPFIEYVEVEGNYQAVQGPFATDAPILGIWIEKSGFRVSVWQWTPGPGPGDFDEKLNSEEEVVELVLDYFFGNNKYFNAYRKWMIDNKNQEK